MLNRKKPLGDSSIQGLLGVFPQFRRSGTASASAVDLGHWATSSFRAR